MKIINALWEKRNFNLSTLEITIEKKDFVFEPKSIVKSIENACKQHNAEFALIKLPAGHTAFDIELQKNLFVLMETQIGLKLLRKDAEMVCKQMPEMFKHSEYREVIEKEEIEDVKQEIRKGIFHTDRFAIDPKIGIKLANVRYANWVQDELDKNAKLFKFLYDKEEIGFFLNRKVNDRKQYALLGGVFNKYKNANLGASMNCALIKEFLQGNLEITETGVSSNNLLILKLHEIFGYRVNSLTYMYSKHL